MDKLLRLQETDFYQKKIESLKQETATLLKQLNERGKTVGITDVRVGRYDEEFYVIGRPPIYKSSLTMRDALMLAENYGTNGWFTHNDIVEFMQNQGKIIEHAMYQSGYVPQADDWIRRKEHCKFKKHRPRLTLQDMRNIMVLGGNEGGGHAHTFILSGGYQGMLAIATPKVESDPPFLAGSRTDAITHIFREQQGYPLLAQDAVAGKEERQGVLLSVFAAEYDAPFLKLFLPHQVFTKQYSNLETRMCEEMSKAVMSKAMNQKSAA